LESVGIGRSQAIWRKLEYQLLPSRLALGFSERLVVGLNPGDWLLLFTDGITEASGPNGAEFGKRNSPRLRKLTVEVPHQS
jgi:serine phosphatase RsbU (regulator of sigma subunit)